MKKVFNPRNIEQKWYEQWESKNYFNADPKSKKPSFCIMIPPPNVTGSLHMGHGFQNTLMDAPNKVQENVRLRCFVAGGNRSRRHSNANGS
tara:strand:+ start:266 stop:538 length:273 start_codon:yes stop_codon:yes gene_type:complete